MTNSPSKAPRWDDRYSAEGYLFGTRPAQFLQDRVEVFSQGQTALVVADGEGRNSVFLAELGLDVTSFDLSSVGIAKAISLAADSGVTVDMRLANILEWDWKPESFDLVVGVFFQFLTPLERADVFEGMKRSVRPGGKVLIHGYTPKQLEHGTGGPPTASFLYTEDLLADVFAGWHIDELRSYEATITEGSGHVGMSALVDLVATKPSGGPDAG